MKGIVLLVSVALVCISAQANVHQPDDEARIRRIIQEQEVGWNQGNARKYCARFQEDSSLTSILGSVYYGRATVEERMAEIFAGVFKSSRISKKVQRIRFVGENVAIVDIDTEVRGFKSLPPGVKASPDGVLRTRLQEVMVEENRTWSVVALHNVDVKTE